MNAPIIDFKGIEWPNTTAMCKHYGITKQTFQNRLQSGWTLKDSLIKPVGNGTQIIAPDGKIFPSIKALAETYGITADALTARMKRGMSLEEALSASNGYVNINIGERFGRLTVIERLKRGQTVRCICDCGGERICGADELVSQRIKSCGCLSPKSKKRNQKIREEFIGRRFGKLIVTSIANDYITPDGHHSIRYNCQCDCGNNTIVNKSSLTKGYTTSCGCHAQEIRIDDLSGQTFGMLTVIDRDLKKKSSNSQWRCKCSCGNIVTKDRSSLIKGAYPSCGCQSMSQGEKLISNLLQEQNIKYQYNAPIYRFFHTEDKSVERKRFDFLLFSSNTTSKHNKLIGVIEYDGEQHFLSGIRFFKNKKSGAFERLVQSDIAKNNFMLKHHIPFLRIRFDQIKNADSFISDFLTNINNYTNGHINPILSYDEYYKLKDDNSRKVIESFNGVTFSTVKAMCLAYNIHSTTYRNRLKRGWSIERALTEPVKKQKNNRKVK